MGQYSFGAGDLFATPNVTNPTTIQFRALQDFSLDFKFDKKTLHGQGQFPLAVARGKGSVEGKVKNATISSSLFASLIFNETPTAGQILIAKNEVGTIPGTPFQITVANDSVFDADLGVIDPDTGAEYIRVAATPAAGEYSVNESTGVYTFNTADTTKSVRISYSYTAASGGKKMTWTNQLMGTAPRFKTTFSQEFEGKLVTVVLFSCQFDDFSYQTKNDDFVIPEMGFSAFTNAADELGTISISD